MVQLLPIIGFIICIVTALVLAMYAGREEPEA